MRFTRFSGLWKHLVLLVIKRMRWLVNSMITRILQGSFLLLATLTIMVALAACGSTPGLNTAQPQQTVTINPRFQTQLSPIPTVPPYRCGSWTSNNAPARGDTIAIYARVTHHGLGVPGLTASATVHFLSGDVQLNQVTSDAGGYVSFTLPLMNRQPSQVPATIDVTFAGAPTGSLTCSTFFTPH